MAETAVAVIAADARKDGRSAGAFELVVTPLADAAGTCRYIIGALAGADPQAARALGPIDALEARSARLSWPSGLRRDIGRRPAPAPGDARQIGRFMVYDGGLEPAAPASTSR
jgi:hypothetical protein